MENNLKNKHLLIFGTGAVGGYYGGMLAKARSADLAFDVTFVARGKNYEVLKQKGLTLIIEGKKEIIPINVVETLRATSLQKQFDYILICVKSKDTNEAAENIRNIIGPNTTVISFQNGVENEDIIAGVIGKEHVIGGLVFVASKLVKLGVVEQFGYNGGMVGELYKDEITQRVLDLQKMMIESGVDCKITENMRGELWNKLVWNTSFNAISVLNGKTVDKILGEDLELVKNIMNEVKDVAIAHGINIRGDTVEFNLSRSKGFVGFKTSTLQDFERGRPIELEELVGVVIRKGKEKNIKVPNVERVYKELKQKISIKV